MPELPDVTVYVESLERHLRGERLDAVSIFSPSFLRSVEPGKEQFVGRRVVGAERLGKRIVLEFEDEYRMVFHLMIAGRLHFRRGAKPAKRSRRTHASFAFPVGELVVTEASTKKRASLTFVRGAEALAAFDRGGIEPLTATYESFREAIRSENHTLKRSLTDPRIFSGIGNAYSDEILHAARLSPVRWSEKLDDEEIARLYEATREVLTRFTTTLREEVGEGFPEKVTAFRPDMAVHGRYREPCPVCGAPVQRIAYADRETNYCAGCQNGGRLLADRALSRLLRKDWPRTLEELEERRPQRGAS